MTHGPGVRIIVLDDDPFMARLLQAMLGSLGFSRVRICGTGRAALALVGSGSDTPDVIVFDLNMPEMNGLEFVRHLAERHYGGSLILISGDNDRLLQDAESTVRAQGIAVLGRLTKPPSRDTLAAMLDSRESPASG